MFLNHWYTVIPEPAGITWTQANTDANALGGGSHLATITESQETDFVFNLTDSINKPLFLIFSGKFSIECIVV